MRFIFTSVEEKDSTINVAFSTAGYDVTMDLTKVDADNMKGSLMGSMFDVKAVRRKD